MDRTPRQGEFYRHFKNKLYQIIGIAAHSETGEPMVVYQALYGDFGLYVRPLDMFVSEVDHEKYPDAGQKYRFERVEMRGGQSAQTNEGKEEDTALHAKSAEQDSAAAMPNAYLMEFLEAEDYDSQMAALKKMDGHVGQQEVDSVRVVLELAPGTGDIRQQLDDIRKYMEMQRRYDGSRLRGQ